MSNLSTPSQGGMIMSGQQNLRTVTGYIITVPDGEAGEGVRVSVETDDGTEYFIVPKGMGLDLMEHVNARAEVRGIVEERGESRFLAVRAYTVRDGFEDDWYDDKD